MYRFMTFLRNHCFITTLFSFIALTSTQCGTVASVTPLGRGHKAITFSSGGPVAPVFGIKMPIPYTVIRYRQGLNENTDFHFGFHAVMAALGNAVIDVGITKHLTKQAGWKPSLIIGGSAYCYYHVRELSSLRAYPEFTLLGTYRLSAKGHYLYIGSQQLVQYTSPYLLLAPLAGAEIPFGTKITFNLEVKWFAPTENSKYRVADYSIKPFNYGAVGFVWGLSYKF